VHLVKSFVGYFERKRDIMYNTVSLYIVQVLIFKSENVPDETTKQFKKDYNPW
jgi:hypothetical protein